MFHVPSKKRKKQNSSREYKLQFNIKEKASLAHCHIQEPKPFLLGGFPFEQDVEPQVLAVPNPMESVLPPRIFPKHLIIGKNHLKST